MIIPLLILIQCLKKQGSNTNLYYRRIFNKRNLITIVQIVIELTRAGLFCSRHFEQNSGSNIIIFPTFNSMFKKTNEVIFYLYYINN